MFVPCTICYEQGRIQDFKLGGVKLKFVWGYFVWKITILYKQKSFFPILGGGGGGVHAGCVPPGTTPDEDHIGGVMPNGQLASLESGGSWVQTPVMPNGKIIK